MVRKILMRKILRMRPASVCALGLLLGCCVEIARADGGMVRVSEKRGRYQVSVFTSPTPLGVGLVDVSVLVQDVGSGQPLTDRPVTICMSGRGLPAGVMSQQASTAVATNKLFRAAQFDVPQPGGWQIEVLVEDSPQDGALRCDVEVGPPAPRWLALWPWIGWPFLAIVLYGVHQHLVARQGCSVTA